MTITGGTLWGGVRRMRTVPVSEQRCNSKLACAGSTDDGGHFHAVFLYLER